MIIDFHTHVFPDHMAKRVVDDMAVATGIMPYLDGTVGALTDSMAMAGIDISVLLPVLTKPSQFKTVNNYELSIAHKYDNGTKLVAFGGVHPDSPTLRDDIREIRRMGMKGIKLHPDYQQIDFDDPRNIRAVDYASEEGLITVVHAGLDMAFARHVHCTPPMAVNLLKEISPENQALLQEQVSAYPSFRLVFDHVSEYIKDRHFYTESRKDLEKYFQTVGLENDELFQKAVTEGSPYQDYNIRGIDHRMEMGFVWVWPWENSARLNISEKIPRIDGRVKGTKADEVIARDGPDAVYPPAWPDAEYRVLLTRENGQWKIKTLTPISK